MTFDSLSKALDGWFDKPLGKLPDELRQRMEAKFCTPWDYMVSDQRRSMAAQCDYWDDPANENERKFWFDFYNRKSAIEEKIRICSSTGTPTANDFVLKENKLAELQSELEMLEREAQQMQKVGLDCAKLEIGSPAWRSQLAKDAANQRHDQPGGSREKRENIRTIWASGKYTSRDICAEQECAALDMSFSVARKALRKTPEPT